jgi:serine/threonine protein kinase
MQYHSRGSLDSLIRRNGPLAWSEVLRLGVKLAGAVETAHRNGVLHRDVKPANILLTEYGEPQLTNFGIARIAGAFETSTGALRCSPAYTPWRCSEATGPARRQMCTALGRRSSAR